jgi:hypothetical protein
MSTLAVISPERSWTESLTHQAPVGSGQVARMALVANLGMYSYRVDALARPQKFLLVTLEGSNISPSVSGAMMANQIDKRGYYTEQVDVKIFFYDDKNSEMRRVKHAPSTSGMAGAQTTTSSLEYTVGGGFFGGTPTSNASVGGSISHSWSENLEDFTLIDNSAEDRIVQTLRLSAVHGGEYKHPSDLIDQTAGDITKDVFSGHLPGSVRELPPRATSNIALITQALFMSYRPLAKALGLRIEVTQHLVMVEKTFIGVAIHADVSRKEWTRTLDLPINFAAID